MDIMAEQAPQRGEWAASGEKYAADKLRRDAKEDNIL